MRRKKSLFRSDCRNVLFLEIRGYLDFKYSGKGHAEIGESGGFLVQQVSTLYRIIGNQDIILM